MAEGTLLGIARKAYPRAPVETLERTSITLEGGVEGDMRGRMVPGKSGRRQVTMFARDDWEAGLAELAASAHWSRRRCNLYVEGLVLPREGRIRVGRDAVLEITGECDPCKRMDEVVPGLFAALMPDWRGGRLMRVIAPGEVAVGDRIMIEEPR